LGRWLVVALLVVWAFVLGVLVGQGTLANPQQVEAFTAGLQELPLVGPWFAPSRPGPSPPAGEEPRLSFYQELEEPTAPPAPAPAAGEAKEDTLPQPPPKGGFAVQVASYQNPEQARALAQRLLGQGLDAYIRQARLPQAGLRYRVRVGPYPSREEAEAAAGRIRLQHELAAYVTKED
jgi:cell division septation protein DedD